jgi:23S rRNA pseudouridine2605 synthase
VLSAKTQKLQKVLADTGLGSRREIERWIASGRVTVNGQRAALGRRISGRDKLAVDGHPVRARWLAPLVPRVLCYHKQVGERCSQRDTEGPTVFERLPHLRGGRWIAVGRLDVNTSGLLLFTDSGEFAHRLMHPARQVEREYAVRVWGEVSAEVLSRLRTGVQLEDGFARCEGLTVIGGRGANRWYRLRLREGRNREIHRLWASQGLRVSRLIRIRYGPFHLRRGLRPGHWEEASPARVAALARSVGMAIEHDVAVMRAPRPPARGAGQAVRVRRGP